MGSGEKISGKFVVACGDGAKMLEFVEEAFDEIAFAVEREVAAARGFAIGLWRNHGGDLPLVEGGDQSVGIVSLVAEEGLGVGAFEQRFGTSQIVSLPWREHQIDGIAQRVDEGVDFGRQSAAGSADRLFAVFFRAPALCW